MTTSGPPPWIAARTLIPFVSIMRNSGFIGVSSTPTLAAKPAARTGAAASRLPGFADNVFRFLVQRPAFFARHRERRRLRRRCVVAEEAAARLDAAGELHFKPLGVTFAHILD